MRKLYSSDPVKRRLLSPHGHPYMDERAFWFAYFGAAVILMPDGTLRFTEQPKPLPESGDLPTKNHLTPDGNLARRNGTIIKNPYVRHGNRKVRTLNMIATLLTGHTAYIEPDADPVHRIRPGYPSGRTLSLPHLWRYKLTPTPTGYRPELTTIKQPWSH